MKKRLSVLLSIVLVVALLALPASASGTGYDDIVPTPYSRTRSGITTITDPSQLERIAIEDDLDIPEGMHLESVTITIVNEPAQMAMEDDFDSTRFLTDWKISNIRTSEVYRTNDYDSDWYYGPATVSNSYSRTKSSELSGGAGVKQSVVEASVGFKIGSSFTNTKTFTATVAAGKKVNVKVHTNLSQKSFSVYKNGQYAGTGTAYKPIGLIFKQYTYAR